MAKVNSKHDTTSINKKFPKCPLCSSGNVSILLKGAEDLECYIPGKWDVYFCNHCLLGFLYPPISLQKALDNYYSKGYVLYHKRKGKILRLMYFLYMQNLAKKIKSLIGDKGKILDVGCGSGTSIAMLSKIGEWDIIGLDPVVHAVRAGKKQGIDVYKGALESFSKEHNERFDLILMFHVIEHLPDPQKDMDHVFKLLKPGGYFIGETQNILSWDFKIFRRYWGMLSLPKHAYFFSSRSLKEVMEKKGFKSCKISYSINTTSLALGLQFLIQEKVLKKQISKRARYYPFLLLLCIPIVFIQRIFRCTGIIKFYAQKPN